ncbi:hypothetical protein ACHAW6_014956 [Cyclotella cf. meneghiniana]
MAAENNMNGVTGHAAHESSYPEENNPTTIKKLFLALIAFIPAFIFLSIVNFAVTEILVAAPFAARPDDTQQPSRVVDSPSQEKESLPPKVVTKIVYVPPTEADLALLRKEIEASDPLPTPDTEVLGDSNTMDSVLSALKAIVHERDEKLTLLAKESDDLNNAHESFGQRFEEDLSLASASTHEKIRVAAVLNEKTASLRSIMSLSEFSALEREALNTMFRTAGGDLSLILKSTDEKVFLNDEGVLLKALVDGSSLHNSSECSPSFLSLDGKNVSSELIIPPGAKMKSKSIKKVAVVPVGTARESDLYQSLEGIKNILSRRELSPMKTGVDGSLHNPLSQIGTDKIQRLISDMALTLKKQRQDHASQHAELRKRWMSKIELYTPNNTTGVDDEDICANSDLVEKMVAGGLESLRKKSDLQSAVRGSLFSAIADESEGKNVNADKIKLLTRAIQDSNAPKIDYDRKDKPLRPASKKFSRKSLLYLVDSPLLHIGFVRWLNYFVDVISGYNDNVDAMLDWIIGDGGSTIGEISLDAFFSIVRLIPYHDRFADFFKAAGILAGRTRALLED